MLLELSDEEAALMREVLASYLKELRGEIVDTDNADYRRTLRRERQQLEDIVVRLEHLPRVEPVVTRLVQVSAIHLS